MIWVDKKVTVQSQQARLANGALAGSILKAESWVT